MDMAISASSRIRECGTASAEAATAGPNFVSGLDTLEDRRCGNGEAGKNGIDERPVVEELLRSTSGIDSNHALLRIYGPNGLATMGQVELDLSLKARSRFRRYNFDCKLRSALENTGCSRHKT